MLNIKLFKIMYKVVKIIVSCTKKLTVVIFCIVLAEIFYSCVKKGEDSGDVFLKINEITEIKLVKNEKTGHYGPSFCVENKLYKLTISVVNLNDGRCPIGVDCCWAGQALVDLKLTSEKDDYDFRFDIDRKGIVIEGIKYRLMDVLPYPVFNQEQTVKTVKILVSEQSVLSDTQWKLIRYQDMDPETANIKYYTLNEPYIIHFKQDFTVIFPLHCRFSQGTFITGNDGSIRFDDLFEIDSTCDPFFYEWEVYMYNSLINAIKYTMIDNQLTIDGIYNRLYFEKI